MNNNEVQRMELNRVLSRWDVLALAFGSAIGWAWIMLAGTWVSNGGVWGAVLCFVAGGIFITFVGLCYAELTSALPLSGGEFVFAYRAMGRNGGFICGWAIAFVYVGIVCWEGCAAATAISYLVDFPMKGLMYVSAGYEVYFTWTLIPMIGTIILIYLNYIGTKTAAMFQTIATIVIAIGGIAFLGGSVFNGDISNAVPTFTNASGTMAVLMTVPTVLIGFDVIPQAAEEMNIPMNKISRIIIAAIVLCAAWYIMMVISIAFAAPEEVRNASLGVPVADAFTYAMGSEIWGKLLVLTGLLGILTSWNGFILGASRLLFALGRAKMLPAIFAKVHPKHQTPVAAVLMVGVLSFVAPFLGRGALIWLIDASAFGVVIAYGMVAIAQIILRKKEPNLDRPYKAPGGISMGVLGVVVAIFFFYLYLPFGPSALLPVEWVLVVAWAVLGVIFYVWSISKYNVSKEEREYMIFGKEYSRF